VHVKNNPPLSMDVFHANTSSETYLPVKSAVRLLSFHTCSYNKCFQVVYRTMSTRSHSSDETFTLRMLSHTYISTASGAVKLGSKLYEVILSCYLPFRHALSDYILNNDLLSRHGNYLRAGRSGFRVPAGMGGVLFSRTSQIGLRPTQLPVQ